MLGGIPRQPGFGARGLEHPDVATGLLVPMDGDSTPIGGHVHAAVEAPKPSESAGPTTRAVLLTIDSRSR